MKTVFLIFSLIASSVSFGQTVEARLSNAMQNMEKDDQFKHAIISLYVIDSKTGKVVFDKNSQLGLAPASCLKVVTSGAALELLGKDYRYKTDLSYDGNIEGQSLKGTINVKVSGDPSLGSWRWNAASEETVLKKIVDALAEKNIKLIEGDLLIDDLAWETQATPRGWTWEDIGNYYGAGARGFNWRENQYDLFLKTGKREGDSVTIVESIPELMVTTINNELTAGKSNGGDNSIIYLPENGKEVWLRGNVPAGKNAFKISGSIPNPLDVFANSFQKYGKAEKSINIVRKSVPATAKNLLSLYSPSLDSINYWFLQKSVNLFGEALVKTIAYEKTGFGATETGLDLIKEFWNKNGIEKSALNIKDGSGLSPANRITTDALVNILQYAKKQNWYSSFLNALPEQNGIKMKSGYISGVRGYSGYIQAKSGAAYTFSFIINNFDGSPGAVREKMWKLLDILK